MNANRVCRTCGLDGNQQFNSLFNVHDGESEVIAHMVVACANVEVAPDDLLPQEICAGCLDQVTAAYRWRKQCQEVDQRLRIVDNELETSLSSTSQKEDVTDSQILSCPSEEFIERIESFDGYERIIIRGVRCCGCSLIFPTKDELVQHSQQRHDGERGYLYQCQICCRRFESLLKLLNHTKFYETKEMLHCSKCQILFDTKYRLDQHRLMSNAHKHEDFYDGNIEVTPAEYLEELEPATVSSKQRLINRKRKTMLRYPDQEFIEKLENHGDYEVIYIRGERCCSCGQLFATVQAMLKHCERDHGVQPQPETFDSRNECNVCRQKFRLPQTLNRHRQICVAKKLFHCKPCGLLISSQSRLEQHLKKSNAHCKSVSNGQTNQSNTINILPVSGRRCCGCQFVAKSAEELTQHSEGVHLPRQPADNEGIGSHVCPRCYERFPTQDELFCHQRLSDDPVLYHCEQCFAVSNSKQSMLEHVCQSDTDQLDTRPESERAAAQTHCCFLRCTEVFNDPEDLLQHVTERHAAKRKDNQVTREQHAFVCRYCQKGFRNKLSILHHQIFRRRGNPLVSQRHTCTTCSKVYTTLPILLKHMRAVHGNQKLHCDQCGKAFVDGRSLKSHAICHTGEREFACDVCGKTFRRKGNLKAHKRCHMTERPWQCMFCSERFKSKDSQLLHQRTHTGERPFQCRYCENRYSHGTDRQRHEMSTHTKERPHQCRHCPAAFIRKRQKLMHERTHTGEKPYKCESCDKVFTQVAYLRRHQTNSKPCSGKSLPGGESQPTKQDDEEDVVYDLLDVSYDT